MNRKITVMSKEKALMVVVGFDLFMFYYGVERPGSLRMVPTS